MRLNPKSIYDLIHDEKKKFGEVHWRFLERPQSLPGHWLYLMFILKLVKNNNFPRQAIRSLNKFINENLLWKFSFALLGCFDMFRSFVINMRNHDKAHSNLFFAMFCSLVHTQTFSSASSSSFLKMLRMQKVVLQKENQGKLRIA